MLPQATLRLSKLVILFSSQAIEIMGVFLVVV